MRNKVESSSVGNKMYLRIPSQITLKIDVFTQGLASSQISFLTREVFQYLFSMKSEGNNSFEVECFL